MGLYYAIAQLFAELPHADSFWEENGSCVVEIHQKHVCKDGLDSLILLPRKNDSADQSLEQLRVDALNNPSKLSRDWHSGFSEVPFSVKVNCNNGTSFRSYPKPWCQHKQRTQIKLYKQ